MKKILLIAGTRPNFIKIAPLFHSFKEVDTFKVKLCHTGQHYDRNMSSAFWDCLELPAPDFDLKISAGNIADTIGMTIVGVNKLLQENHFDLVVVVGDVNATVAGAIAAVQNGIMTMHVEAGLRSFDREMPEENNRILTDHISNLLMVSEPSGLQNLRNEGIVQEKVHFVGNVMIESLIRTRSKWEKIKLDDRLSGIRAGTYIVSTFHRPENVDNPETLNKVISIISDLASDRKVVFPVHPRTKNKLSQFGLDNFLKNRNVVMIEPLGYFEFLKLVSKCDFVITDSGGIQEETTYLKIPCITIRKNTERPVTIEKGTNKLIQLSDESYKLEILKHINKIKSGNLSNIEFWDDKVSERIINVLLSGF
jgi:UDP-N-acetylglucosamine 2-epimerase (non-hydrolysing)